MTMRYARAPGRRHHGGWQVHTGGVTLHWLFMLLAYAVYAAPAAAGELVKVPSRDGVRVTMFWQESAKAVGTVLLFPGGGGGFGQIQAGAPTSRNFVVRSHRYFVDGGYNVAIFGRPSDSDELDYADRISAPHLADIEAVLAEVQRRSELPIWLVATSRGTISATHAAIHLQSKQLAGLVLTASVVSFKKPGAIPRQSIARIQLPTLVVHHKRDGCVHCQPHEVGNILNGLTGTRYKQLLWVDGGHSPVGDPCAGQHFHGFINYEQETVAGILAWMRAAPR